MTPRKAAHANFLIGMGGVALGAVISIGLVPLYFRYVGQESYGAWLTLVGFAGLAGVLEGGLGTALTQKMSAVLEGGESGRFELLAGSAIPIVLAISVVTGLGAVAIGWVALEGLKYPFTAKAELLTALVLWGAGSALVHVHHFFGAIAQAWRWVVIPGLIVLLSQVLYATVLVIALVEDAGIVAFGLGQLAYGLAMASFAGVAVANQWRRRTNLSIGFCMGTAHELLRAMWSLGLARIGGLLNNNIEVSAVGTFVSASDAASYSLASKLIGVLPMVVERVGSAAFAGIAGVERNRRPQVVTEVLAVSLTLLAIGAGIGLALAGEILLAWVGAEATPGLAVIAGIVVSTHIVCRIRALVNLANSFGAYQSTAWAMVLESLIRVVAVFGFAALGGATGVAFAAVPGGLIAVALLSAIVGHAGAQLKWSRIASLGIRGSSLAVIAGLLFASFGWNATRVSTLFVTGLGVALAMTVVVALADRSMFTSALHNANSLWRSLVVGRRK